MRPHATRLLALDVPLALVVGAAATAAAQVAAGPDRFGPGASGWGPDRHGPGGWGPGQPALPGTSAADLGWPLYPSIALVVLATAVRRLWPRAAFVGVVLGVTGYLAAGGPYGPVLLAPVLVVHALASALPLQRWAPLTLLLVPMLWAGFWDQSYLGLLQPQLYGALVGGLAVLVLPAMFALLRRNRREAEQLERQQELRRYAYEERLQIAREVHDVVGHSLSVINLQAGVALHVLHKRPDEVEASLEAIRRTSREALAELRTTLAVYRQPSAADETSPGSGLPHAAGTPFPDDPRAPRPGLARLDDLVAALRAAGREVTLRLSGTEDHDPLPAAVDQAAYRIVQEALTNVVRHADGAPATVVVTRTTDAVSLEISDTGPPAAGAPVEGGGILGMRERAEAVGGELSIDRTGDGFRVTARLPSAPVSALDVRGATG
jgi:signal transduction histidine kinase